MTKDGYPKLDQLAIVTGMLGMLVAKNSDDANDLKGLVAITKELIEIGAEAFFNPKGGGE